MTGPVMTLGEILVEIMRPGVDQPLDQPGDFCGPFPSGAPVIFIDTVARLGWPAAFIGVVGTDAFGQLLLERLRADGVDARGIRQSAVFSTAVAFVAYASDGSRQFVFHIGGAAAGQLTPSDVDPAIGKSVAWLHISGSTMAVNESLHAACLRAVELCTRARVSLDPNLRVELLGGAEQARNLLSPLVRRAEVIFPSMGELEALTGEPDLDMAAAALLSQGPRLVVLKRGAAGCSVYSAAGRRDIPAFPTEEIDPTGAGDAFAAGFVVATLRGMDPLAAALYGNAVGSLAVGKRGPMEGTIGVDGVQALLSAASATPRGNSDGDMGSTF